MNDIDPAPKPAPEPPSAEIEPIQPIESIVAVEAARAHLRHWWREPLAGFLAIGIGAFDAWYFQGDAGLPGSLDQILILGGIVLVAGSKRLFSPAPVPPTTNHK